MGPALCFGVAALSCGSTVVGDVAWVLVGLDRLVGIDPRAQAVATSALCGGVGLLWTVANLRAEPPSDAAADE